jgi:hypothetical protein
MEVSEKKLSKNIKNAGKCYQLVRSIRWKWEMPKKKIICLFKNYYMPILTHGTKTWTWTKADICRLMVAEMRF